MDNLVYKRLLDKAPDSISKSKVKLILNEVFPGENIDVPDPYYDSIYAFRNVYTMLDEATDVILEQLKNGK